MAIPSNQSNQNQKKKKKGSGLWGLAVLAIIWIFNRLDSADVSRLFARLRWMINTGRIDSTALVASLSVVIGLVVVIVVISAATKAAKDKRFDGIRSHRSSAAVSPMSGQSVQHSHDRLQGYRGEESGMDHWKKQLDGFLEAGIIDRSEYRVLLERRRR